MQLAETLDQAAGLRRLLGEQESFHALGVFSPDNTLNASASASLAYALARRGSPVCVLDALPLPRNVAGCLGIPENPGLGDLARRRLPLAEALADAGANLCLIEARQGVTRVAATDEHAWREWGAGVEDLGPEWLILTADESNDASLALSSTLRLLVLPAARNRLPEAYATLKAAHQRQPDGHWRVLVMDTASEQDARELMASLADTARRFLGIALDYAGSIPRDAHIEQAARALRPLLDLAPESPAAQAFRGLAETLPGWCEGQPALSAGLFWQRLGMFARLAQPALARARTRARHEPAHG